VETALLDQMDTTHLPSLDDPAVVAALVRGFARNVLEVRAAWHAGAAGARDPLSAIEAEARLLGDIFLGRDDRYDARPWNTPNRLGMYFTVLLPVETRHYGDPGSALFMWLAAQVAEAARALEQDPAAEAKVQARLDTIVADVIARLLRTKY
jgi:hypothetical protein